MQELKPLAKTDDEFTSKFKDTNQVAVHIRRTLGFDADAKGDFLQKLALDGLTPEQLLYVAKLLTYIEKNGVLTQQVLTTRLSPRGIIDNEMMKKILADINKILKLQ